MYYLISVQVRQNCISSFETVFVNLFAYSIISFLFPIPEECAQETLIIGGPVPGPRKSRHHQSSRSSVSSRSTRSVKSAESAGTFVDKMPYIDGEGQTG